MELVRCSNQKYVYLLYEVMSSYASDIACIFYVVLFASIACIFELLCVTIYTFVFPKLPIVKFYHSKAASEGSKTVNADLAAGGIESDSNTPVSTDLKRIIYRSTSKSIF
jgi:hypothetical protein